MRHYGLVSNDVSIKARRFLLIITHRRSYIVLFINHQSCRSITMAPHDGFGHPRYDLILLSLVDVL